MKEKSIDWRMIFILMLFTSSATLGLGTELTTPNSTMDGPCYDKYDNVINGVTCIINVEPELSKYCALIMIISLFLFFVMVITKIDDDGGLWLK